ncbi:MAG: ATP-binding protein [Chloroflexota bacterium]
MTIAARMERDDPTIRERALLDSFVDPCLVVEAVRDADGRVVDLRFTDANLAAAAYFHQDRERMIGMTFAELRPEFAATPLFAAYVETLETGRSLLLDDEPGTSPAGRRRRFDLRAVRVGDGLSVTWREVTDRSRAMAELARGRRELAEAQRIAHVGSWHWERATDQLTWSDEAARIMGLDPGLPAPLLEERRTGFTPESWERLMAAVGGTVAAGATRELEVDAIRPGGEVRHLLVHQEPVIDGGNVAGIRGTLADITELHAARQALARFNEELEQRVQERTAELRAANEELGSFTYTVSHDLRSPVRAIAGFSRLLERQSGPLLDDVGRHRLENIAVSAETMGRLIDDLLAFTRVGRVAIRSEPVPLGPIVARLRAAHAGRLADLGGRIELAEGAATPLADPTLLEQILLNLVDNAIAYHRPDVPPVVTVSAVATGAPEPGTSLVVVSVRDNGRGIPPEQRERVFEVFTRSTDEQDLAHAGIGLATVRRAARAMGTEVTLESEVGRGTLFSFTLRLAG